MRCDYCGRFQRKDRLTIVVITNGLPGDYDERYRCSSGYGCGVENV